MSSYKIQVSYELTCDRQWMAHIAVLLPCKPTDPNQYEEIEDEYRSIKTKFLDGELERCWGSACAAHKGYRKATKTFVEPTLAALHQTVDRQILNIKLDLHKLVVGYRDLLAQAPSDYELEIDPAIVRIDGIGFEIVEDLSEWRASLAPGDKIEVRFAIDRAYHQYEIADIDKLNYPGQELEYQIRATDGTDIQRDAIDINPGSSLGWRHLVKPGDTLRCKTTPATHFQRVDRVKSVRHNFRTSQMLIVWESDEVQQRVDYTDALGAARPNDLP